MPSIRERMAAFFRPVYYVGLSSDAPTQVLNMDAVRLYQTQDNLRAVIDFLANSIAQLPLKVYDRVGENDRVRDRTSNAALTLWRPNCDQTWYEFARASLTEYFIFGAVYWWVLPDPDYQSGYQLRVVPSSWVIQTNSATNYAPDTIRICSRNNGTAVDVPKSEFTEFRTYSPGNPGGFLSPISSLSQTLHEQIEASRFRKELWHSSGRLNAQIIRPKDVQPWTEETRKNFITAFREAWGEGGTKAGSIPLMEDGMEIKPFQTSFKEQQWAESIQLSRESVCAAYRLNPALIWHTGTQTYASAKDNARALYAECLGPDLQMFQQRINSFLLPMLGAGPEKYVEFDMTEKIKGSFEERAAILQASVGAPWLTRNEARADNNLPPVEGGDELIMPLNLSTTADGIGEIGQDEVQNNQNDGHAKSKSAESVKFKFEASKSEVGQMTEVMKRFLRRQANAVLPKIGARAENWWDEKRWNKELRDDLIPIITEISEAHGKSMAGKIGTEYFVAWTEEYIRKMAYARAKLVNRRTQQNLQEKIDLEDEWEDDETKTPSHAFDVRISEGEILGSMLAGAAAWFGEQEGYRQAQTQGSKAEVWKTWVVNSGNPRASHANMNGETVRIDEPFSNGAFWPGDDNLDPEESCGCTCSTEIEVIRR